VGFIRPHADWRRLPQNKAVDFPLMASRLLMVQDAAQVEVYEDKSEQFRRWAKWMPETWRFTGLEPALAFLAGAPWPLVSKADVGASSVNVRVLANRAEAEAHLRQLFGDGVPVSHGAEKAPKTLQKGYALLQRFIPHKITWRVNAIGDARAIFMRYCYPDRPVAQTGNVEPVMKLTAGNQRLLDYANEVLADIGTKWCALDILQDTDGTWKMLETSLAWPWPSPGKCNEAPIFGSSRRWLEIWDAMFEQIAAGAFGSAACSAAPSSST
jgi:biotin carboxylase